MIVGFSLSMARVTQQLTGDKMPITVSASEAKNRLGSLIEWVLSHQDEVIVESYGSPKAVIMPYPEYGNVMELREQSRRQRTLAKLEQLRQRVQARNQDLTEEQVATLTGRFTKEVVNELIEEGKTRYRGS